MPAIAQSTVLSQSACNSRSPAQAATAMAALLLAFLALGLATADSALATESEWLIEGETLSELEIEESTTISGGTVTLVIPSLESTIECKASSGNGTISTGGSDKLNLSLSKCEVTKSKECKVTEPISLKAKSEPLAAGEMTYAKLQPLSEGTFATIVVKGCGSLKEGALKGSIAAEASLDLLKSQPLNVSESLTKSVNQKLEEEEASTMSLTYGGSTAYMAGKFSVELSGEAHAGSNWQRALSTKLCEKKPAAQTTTCPTGQYWPEETDVVAEKEAGTEMKFQLGFTTTTCGVAKLEGKTSADEGAPLIGTLSVVEFSSCNNGCTVSRLGSNIYLLASNGNVNGDGDYQIPNLKLEFSCGGTICKYRIPVVDLSFAGTAPTLLLRGPVPMDRQSGSDDMCASPGTWAGANSLFFNGFGFEITFPEPTFLTN